MKKNIILLFLLITGTAYGQQFYRISGVVQDSSRRAGLPFVTLTLKALNGTGKPISVLSDSLGNFMVAATERRHYTLTFACVGYKPGSLTIKEDSLRPGMAYHIGLLKMAAVANHLNEVRITAARPLVKQEIDRLSYNVQADADNRSQSVLEMVAKVPLLSVDGEQNVKLKGSGNYKIFINGRPSTMVTQNPKDALRAMPASSVQKIEVITTPPAKYDAEGLAGIINIVMLKRTIDGYNATVGANFNNTVGTGENGMLSAKKGKFGITGRAYIYQDMRQTLDKETSLESTLPSPRENRQSGTYAFVGNYQSESMELSYEADSLHLFTSEINFYRSAYHDQTDLLSSTFDGQSRLLQAYRSVNVNPQKESGLDFNINYQIGFSQKKNRLLTFSYQYRDFPNHQSTSVTLSQKLNYDLPSYLQQDDNGTKEQTLQADFVEPAKSFTVEAGIKAILRHNFSTYTTDIFDPASNLFTADPAEDNNFDYHQNVYSLYNSWQFKWHEFEFKTGARLERTNVNADFSSQNTALEQGYTNLIPVVSVQKQFKNSAVTLGYTQRIARPGIFQLNPFINRSNPQFISTGNPGLRSVLNNNFELGYSRYGKGSLNVTFSYAFANNTIQQVTSFQDTTSFTTYRNIGKSKTAGLNASFTFPVTPKLTLSINSQLNLVWISGYFGGQFYANNGPQGYGNASLTYKLNDGFRATASFTYVSSDVLLQGHTSAYIYNAYRLTKDLFSKKFSVTAAINNPYSKYRYVRTETIGDGFRQFNSNQRFYRSFSISLNYNFGNLKSSIRKNERSINNDDVLDKTKQ